MYSLPKSFTLLLSWETSSSRICKEIKDKNQPQICSQKVSPLATLSVFIEIELLFSSDCHHSLSCPGLISVYCQCFIGPFYLLHSGPEDNEELFLSVCPMQSVILPTKANNQMLSKKRYNRQRKNKLILRKTLSFSPSQCLSIKYVFKCSFISLLYWDNFSWIKTEASTQIN